MARELSQIMAELNASFQPQRDEYNKQLGQVDPAESLDLQGLEQAKKDSFEQINTGANRRGMFYSGMPIEEQAKYVGANYLPAIASIKNRYGQFRNNLRLALAELAERQNTQALGIRQNELDLDEKRRQWEAEMAFQREQAAASRAAASGGGGGFFGGGYSGGGGSEAPQTGGYGMKRNSNGTFAFVDPYGNAVSAAKYSAATGIPFIDLLKKMASQGDKGATQALGWVGNDYGYDPTKITDPGLYNALVWGTGNKYTGGSPIRSISVPTPGVQRTSLGYVPTRL